MLLVAKIQGLHYWTEELTCSMLFVLFQVRFVFLFRLLHPLHFRCCFNNEIEYVFLMTTFVLCKCKTSCPDARREPLLPLKRRAYLRPHLLVYLLRFLSVNLILPPLVTFLNGFKKS
jgi:hypothetical protein